MVWLCLVTRKPWATDGAPGGPMAPGKPSGPGGPGNPLGPTIQRGSFYFCRQQYSPFVTKEVKLDTFTLNTICYFSMKQSSLWIISTDLPGGPKGPASPFCPGWPSNPGLPGGPGTPEGPVTPVERQGIIITGYYFMLVLNFGLLIQYSTN